MCFPNEPLPGWTKSVHFLLVNSNPTPRDNSFPNIQSASTNVLILLRDVLLWFDLLLEALKKVLASLKQMPLLLSEVPSQEVRPSTIKVCQVWKGVWMSVKTAGFSCTQDKRKNLSHKCMLYDVRWFFHQLLLLKHFLCASTLLCTGHSMVNKMEIPFSLIALPWHFKCSFPSFSRKTDLSFLC